MDVTPEDVIAAHARIQDGVHRTPVMCSHRLNAQFGVELYFKCENLQKVGAFKARGALNAVRQLTPAQRHHGVITHSSGNHAQALARAARLSGLNATVVMPSNAPANKKAAVLGYGARVIECEPTLAAREHTTQALMREGQQTLIHPYDDPLVIAGQGTAAWEFIEQCPDLEALIVPVGGGGLMAGTALAVLAARANIAVIGAEPVGAADAHAGLTLGVRQTGFTATTSADGLRAELSPRTFALMQAHVADIFTVSEAAIWQAMGLIVNTLKLVVEPSAAVALASLVGRTLPYRRVGIILSGGNVDPTLWSALSVS
jgi:threonine dehydratase